MNVSDILILAAVVLALGAAVLSIRRRKKAGKGCCGSCEGCNLCRTKPDKQA